LRRISIKVLKIWAVGARGQVPIRRFASRGQVALEGALAEENQTAQELPG
jgi:hypothetical protein